MALTVDSEESNAIAVELGTRAKKLNKTLEVEKKRIIDQPNDFIKAVRNFCKSFQDQLIRVEQTIKQKITTYQTKREKIETPVMPELSNVTRTDSGSSYMRKKWIAEVIDEDLVPMEYKTKPIPDLPKINKAVKAGIREIAGVRIYQETKTVFKS
jgi:hypothetical protein